MIVSGTVDVDKISSNICFSQIYSGWRNRYPGTTVIGKFPLISLACTCRITASYILVGIITAGEIENWLAALKRDGVRGALPHRIPRKKHLHEDEGNNYHS